MFRFVLTLALLNFVPPSGSPGEAALMRHADIHGDQIVFTYEDDLWLVSDEGGLARRITRHAGSETHARFNPDGSQLAFTASYDGGCDVYLMDAVGGVPTQLSFAPGRDRVLDWYPDGSAILFRANRVAPVHSEEIYRIAVGGGMPQRLPVDRGGLASLNDDASKLAYNRISRETETWKRYQGGMAQEIWIADLETGEIGELTDWKGTDNYPMWWGDRVYFTSDRYQGTLNLFSQDPATGEVERLTNYSDYDVKYPAMGDARIVFQHAERIHVLDLRSGAVRAVPISIPSDGVAMRPEWVEVAPSRASFGLTPDASQAVIEARGEILIYPLRDGDPFNLTESSGSREKNAVVSPDGAWIAYVSDEGGEEQVWIAPPSNEGEARRLTQREGGLIRQLVWSPGSDRILFSDKQLALYVIEVESGVTRLLDQGEWDDAWERWGITEYCFSPDGSWVAYSKQHENSNEGIHLVPVEGGEPVRITDPLYASWNPSFSPDGEYLYFLSNRSYSPKMGAQDQNHVFLEMARPYMVLLRADQTSPFRGFEDGAVEELEEPALDAAAPAEAATQVDFIGIQNRILACEGVEAGDWWRLEATSTGFVMLELADRGFLKYQNVDDANEAATHLWNYSLQDANAQRVLAGIQNYHLSGDGTRLIYRSDDGFGVVGVGENAELGTGALDLSTLRIRLVRREEYRQIFQEAWRIQRDWFYDPGMHGVDWDLIREKYQPLVEHCGTRGDLLYLIGEMIAELNTGHTYVWGGDEQTELSRVEVGLLGCDFEAGEAYYRISHIVPGVSWDPRDRSPLAEPGTPIRQGDYLIAIDGVEVPLGSNVYAQLVNKADRWVTLTTNDRPDREGAKDWRVKTLSRDHGLRYREWVEMNRAKVDRWSAGKVGYVHIPDMDERGLREFGRYWYPQTKKQAILIDDRYNDGGFTGDMIVDRLERQLWGISTPREGGFGSHPEQLHHGPFLVLVNEDTSSNGEYFATAIQTRGLAPIVGVRTWGGAVSIEPHQDLVDGGVVTPPQFGLYGLAGAWMIEGVGVVPDFEVRNQPASVVAGVDTQLRVGVDMLLQQLEDKGARWRLPKRPEFPKKAKPQKGRSL